LKEESHKEITFPGAIQVRNTASFEHHFLSLLCATWNADIDIAVKGWYPDNSTKKSPMEWDSGLIVEVCTLTLENAGRHNIEPYEKIPPWALVA
jgi:hypothetical protein